MLRLDRESAIPRVDGSIRSPVRLREYVRAPLCGREVAPVGGLSRADGRPPTSERDARTALAGSAS
jgi:hypothetical protein